MGLTNHVQTQTEDQTSEAQTHEHAVRAWVHLAPVESMLEGDSGVTSAISAKQGVY